MDKYTIVGKDIDEVKKLAENKLSDLKDNLLFLDPKEKKSLFGKKIEYTVIKRAALTEQILEYVERILNLMDITSEISIRYDNESIQINIVSSNDALLIGKHGKNLQSFNVLLNQYVYKILKEFFLVQVDINGYQKKREKELEKLVRKVVKEVQESKFDVKLTSMNSYERKFIHHLVDTYPHVCTQSEGIEPNRYIVIKYKSS